MYAHLFRTTHLKSEKKVQIHSTLINTQRQETELIIGREKVGKGAIWKMGTQGEIASKPKPAEEKDTRKKERQRKKT